MNHQHDQSSLTALQLAQLLVLASSNLPIGSYTYSQGVESAISEAMIQDESSALQWLMDYQCGILLESDLVLFVAIMQLQTHQRTALAELLAEFYQASRDTKEFAYESLQLAQAFEAWIRSVLQLDLPLQWVQQGYLPLLARLCQYWKLNPCEAVQSFAFSQMENLTLVVVKTLPLGQMAGQRILWTLQQHLVQQLQPRVAHICSQIDLLAFDRLAGYSKPDQLMALLDAIQLSTAQPRLSDLSCLHEQQYSRLFRS